MSNEAGIFSGFPGNGCHVPEILGIGMGMSALRHCRRRKARTVFSDPQLTGLEKRFEAQRFEISEVVKYFLFNLLWSLQVPFNTGKSRIGIGSWFVRNASQNLVSGTSNDWSI